MFLSSILNLITLINADSSSILVVDNLKEGISSKSGTYTVKINCRHSGLIELVFSDKI